MTGSRKRNGLPLSGAEMAWPLCVCGRKGSYSSSIVLLRVCCWLTSCGFAGVDIPGHARNSRTPVVSW